ncbi:hypothetical protein NYZ99_12330 [Maribacter litopenaei]|uniref:Vanillate O-demethylase oxygenase-like C-terminal catalytic domain-containing protein n=1 Tax=Maribacter litopenaei TaxID=2976127 RepID=A0ABY5YE76_9FLAO|nr:hypothetical protein [Maribacter litopenaei]UWX56597.1 hypothetical protein NYZ99_12330 [Maribacter litopenaei]
MAEAPFDVHYDEHTATVTRWMKGIDPPPFWKSQLNKKMTYDGLVDRWQVIKFQAPCTVNIDVGVAIQNTGAPEGNRSQGVNGYVLNTMTPSTNQTCYYFGPLPETITSRTKAIRLNFGRECPGFSPRTRIF